MTTDTHTLCATHPCGTHAQVQRMPVFKPMAPYPWDADPALAAAPGSPAATSQTRPCTTLLEARSHAHIHTPARACARGGATPPSGAAASQKQSTYKKRVGAEQSRAPTSFVYTLQPCQGVMCRLHTHTHTHLTDRPRFLTPLSDTPPPPGFTEPRECGPICFLSPDSPHAPLPA